MHTTTKILLTLFFIFNLMACNDDDSTSTSSSSNTRFLYTSSNATANTIITLKIDGDGSVVEVDQDDNKEGVQALTTGGTGDAADDDFDGQNALVIFRGGTDYLLAVNAGSETNGQGSISVFSINRNSGALTRIDQNSTISGTNNISSLGVRPVSLSAKTTGNKTWVLVANQYHNPYYAPSTTSQSSPTTNGSLVASNDRNLVAFEFNTTTGVLASPTVVATYTSPNYGGPSQVGFSPDGKKVAVTTWGVPHFGSTGVNADVQRPSRIYFYDATITSGQLSLIRTSIFEKKGVSGSIGFSWHSDSDKIFVANFNVAAVAGAQADFVTNYAVTVVSATGTGAGITFSNVIANSAPQDSDGTTTIGNEVCWTWLSADNSRLYTASFASNRVSYFSVASSGALTHQATYKRNGIEGVADLPAGDSKDLWLSSNGSQLYVVGALQTHTMGVYNTTSDGFLAEQTSSPYRMPSSLDSAGNTAAKTTHAYLGLVGY